MASGIAALDALFSTGRSLAAIPEGARQEGVGGAFRGFLQPKEFEQTKRARGAREDFAQDIQRIENMAAEAQTINEIEPAWGMLWRAREELERTGADARVLDLTLGKTAQALKAKSFALIDSMDPNAPLKLSQLAGAAQDPSVTTHAQSLQNVFAGRELANRRGADAELARARTTSEEQLRGPRVDSQQALAEQRRRPPVGRGGGGGFSVNDVDRLQAQVQREINNLNQTDMSRRTATPETVRQMVSDLNERRRQLGMPRLTLAGAEPGSMALTELPDEQIMAVGQTLANSPESAYFTPRQGATEAAQAAQPVGAPPPGTPGPTEPPAAAPSAGWTAQPYQPEIDDGGLEDLPPLTEHMQAALADPRPGGPRVTVKEIIKHYTDNNVPLKRAAAAAYQIRQEYNRRHGLDRGQ